jgi:aromatic-L-amino-acid/L-tryptophan decarboxylase
MSAGSSSGRDGDWSSAAALVDRAMATVASKTLSMANSSLREPTVGSLDWVKLGPGTSGCDLQERVDDLWTGTLATAHPRYFGLFNPAADPIAVAGDLLVSAINPQLAGEDHAPVFHAIEIEVARWFASLVWPDRPSAGGITTTGGSESNLTAVLLALQRGSPRWRAEGVRAFEKATVLTGVGSHATVQRAVTVAGVGASALEVVGSDPQGAIIPAALQERLEALRRAQEPLPVLVVATAGGTETGYVDALGELGRICDTYNVPLHIDAAWGGAALIGPDARNALNGIARATSVAVDPHKWLGIPRSAGLLLVRDADELAQTFRVASDYGDEGPNDLADRGLAWTRRALGFPLWAVLKHYGADTLGDRVERDMALGRNVREVGVAFGWRVTNRTALPLVCLAHPVVSSRSGIGGYDRLRAALLKEGYWCSVVRSPTPALRICITSSLTRASDVEDVMAAATDLARVA